VTTKRIVVSVPVVQNGVIVSPALTRQVPVAGASPARNGQTKTKTAQEVTIAVELDEVGWVTEALTVHATLTCVARSGHPIPPAKDELLPIPVAARAIPAYSRITKNQLFDPLIRSITAIYLRAEYLDAPPDAIRDMNQIIGRVLRHDKLPGSAFTEADFYPVGTPAGVTAAVPPGKRSFVFEADKIQGIAALRQGDHFDIVSAVLVDDKLPMTPGTKTISLGVTGTSGKRVAVRPVVQNGVVLIPVSPRQIPILGGQPKMVQEITVAIEPGEVAALTETLAIHTTLTCVARSGQPSGRPEQDVPGKPLDVKVTTIETIVGGKRQSTRFTEPVELSPRPAELFIAPTPRLAVAPKSGQ
jgi:hypothetical protein